MSEGISRQQQKCVYKPKTKHGMRFLAWLRPPKIIPCGNISLWLNLHIHAILLILLYLPFIHYYYIHRSISQLFKLIYNNIEQYPERITLLSFTSIHSRLIQQCSRFHKTDESPQDLLHNIQQMLERNLKKKKIQNKKKNYIRLK